MFDFNLPCRMSKQAPSKVSRRQWDSKNMEAAMKAVQEEGMTVSGASKQFSVLRTTLDDVSRAVSSMAVNLVHALPSWLRKRVL